MLRGGSWNNNPRNVRSANRNDNNPTNTWNNNGFRVVVVFGSPSRSPVCQKSGVNADSRPEQGSYRPVPVSFALLRTAKNAEPGRGK